MGRNFTMRHILVIAALAGLGACAPSSDPTIAQRGAGTEALQPDFGAATANNIAVMADARAQAISLTRRFAASVPTTVSFAFDSAALDTDSQAILALQADFIRQFPELRFRVFGHTDLVGSDAYNRRLGLRRAQAVVGYLASLGIDIARLEAVVSFGETRPLIPTPDPELRNRRSVTEVSGFVGRPATVLNGKYAAVIFRDYVASAAPTGGFEPSTSISGDGI